jgi:two-component sensor histidine kinase
MDGRGDLTALIGAAHLHADDGIGMPEDPATAKAGLGSGIVEALARQLPASVVLTHSRPGASISIVHRDAAVAAGEVTSPLAV